MPKPKVKFGDAAKPSPDEIRAWAGCADLEPMEDWDLVISASEYVPVLLELAADEKCPSRRYVIGALYVHAGECVRKGADGYSRILLEVHVAAARQTGNPWLTAWAQRTTDLLADPASFEFVPWMAGGHAKRPTL